jgi:hypothetical protein
MAETQVSIRIDLETGGRIGPGKIALLEAISNTGSITAAARSMNMSYRRAWLLVDELNKLLSEPLNKCSLGRHTGHSIHFIKCIIFKSQSSLSPPWLKARLMAQPCWRRRELPWEKRQRALRLSHIRRPKSSGQNPVVRGRHGDFRHLTKLNLRKFKNGEMQKARQYADRHVAHLRPAFREGLC